MNSFEGEGSYKWPNGRIYEGQWKNNKMDGYGSFSFGDGRLYFGFFQNDWKSGLGSLKNQDGSSFNGFWKNDLQHGKGIILDSKGKILAKGEWIEGVKKYDFGENENIGFEDITELIKKRNFNLL